MPATKMFAATALMAGCVFAIKISPLYPRGMSRMIWSTQLALLLCAGAAIYLAASHVMGLETFRQLLPRRPALGRAGFP